MKRNSGFKTSNNHKIEQRMNNFVIFVGQNLEDASLQFKLRKKRNLSKNYEELHLQNNQLTKTSILTLAPLKWDRLNELNIANNLVGDRGCKILATINMPQLQILDLSSNNVSDLGTKYLSKMKLSKLNYLYLSNNNILHEGKSMIKADLPNLCHLSLDDNKVSRVSMIKVLQSNWPIFAKFDAGKQTKNSDDKSFERYQKDQIYDFYMEKFMFKSSRYGLSL